MSAVAFGDTVKVYGGSLADLQREIDELVEEIADLERERDDLGKEICDLEDRWAELTAELKDRAQSPSASADDSFPDPPFGATLTPPIWPYNDEVQP